MRRCLFLIGMAAFVIRGAEAPYPSRLYIASAFFSDDGGAFYYRLIDAQEAGRDTIIRYSRVASLSLDCPRKIVQSAQVTVHRTLTELVKSNNPCAVKPTNLEAALRARKRAFGVFEAVSFGIVAQCGRASVVLALPITQKVDMDGLRQSDPQVAHLWDLASDITGSAFGATDIFHDRADADDLILQRAGERLVPELNSGRYDAGLTAAVKGNIGGRKALTFRSLLDNYRGPVTAADAKAAYTPELVDPKRYQFKTYVAPVYPNLARMARIQGQVELELTARRSTGEILGATALSGHPLLKPRAIEAAQHWRFQPGSLDSETIRVMLNFALKCP